MGLFDDPYRYCDATREKEMLYHPDHRKAALDMAKKSIVLLKNDNDLLPLKKTQQKIAVLGALANDKTSPLGSWRIGSDDNTAISVLEGLKKFTNQFQYATGVNVVTGEVSFTSELTVNETDRSGFASAIKLAKSSEVVIMVLGEHGFMSGEGRSRTRLNLPGLQQQLLEEVYKVNKNIVLVLMNGRPLALPWATKNIPAIVEAWHLGTESGNAIAEILFGAYNPSGKLPMSFPRSEGQVPIYYNQMNTGRPGPKPDVFWSHYSDESNQPLFPFGYGLSYTKFAYTDIQIDSSVANTLSVSAIIKNTGKVGGEEVVQLYIRDRVASVSRPIKELKGFEKIKLSPGESKKVSFLLSDEVLGFYNNEGKFVVEAGEFDVMIGTNSNEALQKSFHYK